eukprot:GFKZ01011303.1.p1 GENE.GFKZ01011303.1~~GFKZ01011303.1.p1  ORF type:complete len:455 (-),score=45.40 GFKZ01011303.1:336-1700(-)
MSLTNLPTEALAQISAHLSHTSRLSLSLSHPSITRQFSPSNTSLWFDISSIRHPVPNRHPIPFPASPLKTTLLHDLVDDYLLHLSFPYDNIHGPGRSPPQITSCDSHFYTASAQTFIHHAPSKSGASRTHCLKLPPAITSLYATPRLVVVGLINGAAYLYDPRLYLLPALLKGHRGAVTSSLLVNDTVITGSTDRTIRMRNVHTHRKLAVLRGHDAPVAWLAPTDTGFVSHGGNDGRVKLWDVNRALCISTGRPGVAITHCEAMGGVVYVGGKRSVSVLDMRMGMDRTAAILSLPRGRGWSSYEIGCMQLGRDGRLVAGVGGGGVAVWEARGGWEARGLGWPGRWAGREGGGLKAILLLERSVVVGGSSNELLTFGLDGRFEGVVAEDGRKRGPVCSLEAVKDGILIGRIDGAVDLARVSRGVPDWERALEVLDGEKGRHKFWRDGEAWDYAAG